MLEEEDARADIVRVLDGRSTRMAEVFGKMIHGLGMQN